MALKALTIASAWCACKLPAGACSICTVLKDGGISLLVTTGVSSITNGHRKARLLTVKSRLRSLAHDHSLRKNPVRSYAVRDSTGTNRAHC